MTRRSVLGTLSAGLALSALAIPHAALAAGDERIIVSGASGQLGKLTVQALLDRGVPAKSLILVSRTPDSLEQFRKLGAETRFGDFAKPESLAAAYAGGRRMVLISIGFGAGPRPEAHKRAIDAAKAAGVKQIAYTSWIGISRGETTGLSVDHLATEEILRKSGVAWTFLRNAIYMDRALQQAQGMIRSGKASVPPNETKLDYVTREDCAAAAAAVVTTPGHDNEAYDISGPEFIGVREIAAAASAVGGKPVEVTPPASGDTPAAATTTAIPRLIGRPATSIKDYLEAAQKS